MTFEDILWNCGWFYSVGWLIENWTDYLENFLYWIVIGHQSIETNSSSLYRPVIIGHKRYTLNNNWMIMKLFEIEDDSIFGRLWKLYLIIRKNICVCDRKFNLSDWIVTNYNFLPTSGIKIRKTRNSGRQMCNRTGYIEKRMHCRGPSSKN